MLLVGSVPRLQDCSFLPSGVCPLEGEARLEPSAVLLLGRAMSAQGWVVMGLGPLMGRGMSRGGYGLRKFLKQLVYWWLGLYHPPMLVFWLEASQHWHLSIVR